MELIIAKAGEDLIALLGADGAYIADGIVAGMQKEESPEALGGAEDAGGNSLLLDRAGFRIRPGEVVGNARFLTLLRRKCAPLKKRRQMRQKSEGPVVIDSTVIMRPFFLQGVDGP